MKPESFWKGKEAKRLEIKEMGFEAARDKFNLENPIGCKYKTMDAYYFASGECEALVEALK